MPSAPWVDAVNAAIAAIEFGTGPSADCLATLEAALSHLDRDGDVWLGWTYWVAGGWWSPDDPLSVEPRAGVDRPQTRAPLAHKKAQGLSTNSCASPRAKMKAAPGVRYG